MPRALTAAALVGSCCVAMGARADEFSWDLFGGLSQGSQGDLTDTDGTALSASHYFSPVDDSRGPYGLASFLDPVSSVSAGWNHEKITYHPVGFFAPPPGVVLSDTSRKTDDYTLGGRYVLPASKWYAGGDYTKTNDPDSSFADAKAYRVLGGKYLGANTSLELAMSRVEQDDDGLVQATTETIGPSFVHVGHFRSLSYSLFGGVSQTNAHLTIQPPANNGVGLTQSFSRIWTYSVGTELFPTNKLGFRLSYTHADTDFNNDSYDAAATWFVKRKIGVQFTWSQTQFGPRTDTASVRFVGRF